MTGAATQDAPAQDSPGNNVAGKKLEPTAEDLHREQSGLRSTLSQPKKLLRLVHRLLVVWLTIAYVALMFHATSTSMALLRGRENPWNPPEDLEFPLVAGFLSDSTIRASPLVVDFLGNSTEPVSGTIYFTDSVNASLTPCQSFSNSQTKIYSDAFMRTMYEAIAQGADYNVAELTTSETELVAPLVDCEASTTKSEDASMAKFFFLVRQRAHPQNVSVLVVYLSNQQYRIPAQLESGPAAIATLQLIDDMRATDVDQRVHYVVSRGFPYAKLAFRVYGLLATDNDGLLTLQLVPTSHSRERAHMLHTACREGFFLKAESEQSNINNYHWLVEAEASLAVSRWRWMSKSVLHDSWAWVHSVQFFIGMNVLSNLVVLGLATFHSFREGKPWIGDAFISLSTAQFLNGAAVLVSWIVNDLWALREWCYSTTHQLAGYGNVIAREEPVHADLLTLYLAVCGVVGHVFRERIDPLLALVVFKAGYEYRIFLLGHMSASLRVYLAASGHSMYMENSSPRVRGQDKISPMAFWTTHPLADSNYTLLFATLLPQVITFAIPLLYVLVRKVFLRMYSPRKGQSHRPSRASVVFKHSAVLADEKQVLTQFEVATGASLGNRFGVATTFKASSVVDGVRLASADGVYSAGFVIANKKYLLQTSDFWSIVLMKLLQRRYRNIFVFDVTGDGVQQTARLVYPNTLTVQDLRHVSVATLA